MTDEVEFAALDPRVRWIIDEMRQPVALSGDGRARVMDAVRAEPAPLREEATPPAWRWALRRRTMRMSPLVGGLLAAGLVGIGVLAGLLAPARGDGLAVAPAEGMPAGDSVPARLAGSTPHNVVVEPGVVKFVFVSPSAARVSLVGDFNEWNPDATPMQRTGGTWTVTVPLRAGRHLYSFVVDGTDWLPDPSAPLADGGFGHTNSVVLVGGSSS
jgi:hypothetical protein